MTFGPTASSFNFGSRSSETYKPAESGNAVPFMFGEAATPCNVETPIFIFGNAPKTDMNNDQGVSSPNYACHSQERPPFQFSAPAQDAAELPTAPATRTETMHPDQHIYTPHTETATDQPIFQFGRQPQEVANSDQQAVWESALPPPNVMAQQLGQKTVAAVQLSAHIDHQAEPPGNVFAVGRTEQMPPGAGTDPSVNGTATNNLFARGPSGHTRRRQPRGRRVMAVQAEQQVLTPPAGAVEGLQQQQQQEHQEQKGSCSSSSCCPTSKEPEAAPADLMQSLEKARACAAAARFPDAAKACLASLSGPVEAVDLLRELLDSWEGMERQKIVSQENVKGQLTAQLMDARERAVDMRHQRDDKAVEVATERRRREDAERETARLKHSYGDLLRERERLNEQLRRANEQRSRLARAPAGPPSTDDMVRHLARKECEALRKCDMADRQAIKKKLLLKWHPDKQPSANHSGLATQVMQEIQNCEEWSW